MNILMVLRYIYPHKGGVERHVEELSLELIKRGHKITVITEQYSNDLKLKETYKGIKIVRIPYFAIESKRLVWTWMDEHNYLIEQADLVHVHDVFWWYWPTRLIQLIKPVYITFHGYEGSELPRWQAVVHRKAAELMSYGSICVGDFMRKWYLAKPKIVTYGALKQEKIIELSKKNNKAVFWGRFDYDTGIDTYIEGLKLIDNIKFLRIYGAGPLEKVVIESVKNSKYLKYFRWEKDVSKIVGNSEYAFVSRYLSILEAMFFRCTVVAVYNNEIKKDYLECHPMRDNMIIAGSAQEMADKVNELEKDPKRKKRMIERAHKWAKEQTWSKMADLYEQLWHI